MSNDLNRSKECARCRRTLDRRPRDSKLQWVGRKYCSKECANQSRDATPVYVRFWRYVDKCGQGECWTWMGSKDGSGYGRIKDDRGKSPLKAYRLSWEMHNRPLKDGEVVCHRCDNPSCVNPDQPICWDAARQHAGRIKQGAVKPNITFKSTPRSARLLRGWAKITNGD